MKTVTEWCPNCTNEVELVAVFAIQECPECKETIFPCSMCEDINCRNCPLARRERNMKTSVVHSYIDNLIDNTDGKFDKLGSCWFIVPTDWLEKLVKKEGWNDLEDFYDNYTYDHSDGYMELAIEEGILLGCGAGVMNEQN
ncbi:hypothetical protein COJ96_10810 [Bacillus sp. AFS073361]|uniref:hypothetical protein n=1 Tax=Bacillus sp. AFS073361 TaxID=2033511 RepID=UPI000C0120CF|nr:hypothetical protein [Bacillus sp. AFS073361]PFP29386.1 hypothetical protein COJ96_10810 [Bacillus sp. AFS073361]